MLEYLIFVFKRRASQRIQRIKIRDQSNEKRESTLVYIDEVSLLKRVVGFVSI